MTVEERIKEIVSGLTSEKIENTSNFKEDLYLDSLDLIEELMMIEEDYGIEISDADAEKLITVQDAIDYIEKLIK